MEKWINIAKRRLFEIGKIIWIDTKWKYKKKKEEAEKNKIEMLHKESEFINEINQINEDGKREQNRIKNEI